MDTKPPQGIDVYHWPEFKALAKRLNIMWEKPTKRLVIEIPIEGFISIIHTYHGEDSGS